ncbi:hypothetical protein KHC28_03445 [Ancylobacter sonchi]|uniref:hypothetical protein n=1 Tax=Ancylobacter sonchi TaxID=1937790 RepID=UPI001BD2EF7D|nr:hypothetical protein [Ancylobacter sonchi]MBS7532705.1 hypothetical protein [Ancylobacter sonchi]
MTIHPPANDPLPSILAQRLRDLDGPINDAALAATLAARMASEFASGAVPSEVALFAATTAEKAAYAALDAFTLLSGEVAR